MNGSNFWFIGTGHFAALCLEGLTQNNITLSKIITGLPTRSGRNNKDNPSAVELKALSLGLNVSRTGKLTENQELLDELEQNRPDIVFVIDFGQIIREPLLSCICLNIHPSLLPEYRGAAPIQRALMNGDKYTGVSVFRLIRAMDAGDILAQERIEILPDYNASDLYHKLSAIGCDIAVRALNDLRFTPQDNSKATYAEKLTRDEFEVSFSMSSDKFSNTVRALDMSGGAYIMVRGKRLKLWRVSVRDDLRASASGEVISLEGNPVISCESGAVELLEVQSEGRNKVSGSEWARGMRLKTAEIL